MEPTTATQDISADLADDILRGTDEIAEFLFGNKTHRRKLHYLIKCTKLPIFWHGSVLCARRSDLLNWISGQESRGTHRGS